MGLQSKRDAYLRMLSLFIGETLTNNIQLEKPVASGSFPNEIKRPELTWYAAQEQRYPGIRRSQSWEWDLIGD